MGCYQFKSGTAAAASFGVSGEAASLTRHRTEADCLNACKEGACCEGGNCTIRPKCRCKCMSNSCCGPDTMSVGGVNGPVCRGGTEAECVARGGTWRPCYGCAADAAIPSQSICSQNDRPQVSVPVFKGVGTTCSPNPCCSCESLVSVTIKLPQVLGGSQITRAGCNGEIMANSTMLNWTCTSSGFTISLSNIYQTKSDGVCQHPAYFAPRSYNAEVAATSSSGPCASVVISGCPAAASLAAKTLTKGDFTALPEGQDEFNQSIPASCWTFGSPSSGVLFPEWVKIGPASNPLP